MCTRPNEVLVIQEGRRGGEGERGDRERGAVLGRRVRRVLKDPYQTRTKFEKERPLAPSPTKRVPRKAIRTKAPPEPTRPPARHRPTEKLESERGLRHHRHCRTLTTLKTPP